MDIKSRVLIFTESSTRLREELLGVYRHHKELCYAILSWVIGEWVRENDESTMILGRDNVNPRKLDKRGQTPSGRPLRMATRR